MSKPTPSAQPKLVMLDERELRYLIAVLEDTPWALAWARDQAARNVALLDKFWRVLEEYYS